MIAFKLGWAVLFLLALAAHALLFFGAASGGSTNPPMMYAIWFAVLVGLGCGLLTIIRFVTTNNLIWLDWAAAMVAIWPLFWLALAIAREALK